MAKKKLTIEEKLQAALVPAEEQPYKVPENWCWVKLGAVITASKEKQDVFDSETKYVGLEHIEKDTGNISFAVADGVKSTKSVFKCGDILYGKLRPYLNKHGIVDFDGVCSTDILVFNAIEGDNRLYDFYFSLPHFIEYAVSNSKGINLPRVSEKVILEIPFPMSPQDEQSRIVARIESLFAKLDEAKEKIQEVLDGADLRRAAILHQAFTGKLTEKWRRENGVSDESWEIKTIGELCTVVRGGSPRPAGDERYYNGDIPFMKVADITRNNGPYVNTTEHTIKEAGLGKTRMVEANTLLLTNSGATLGVPAICTIRTTFNDGIAAFLDLEPNDIKFFYYFWTTMTHQLRNINQGAAQPNLNTDIIKSISLKVPTIFEQQEIVHLLDNLLTREQSTVTACEEALTTIDTFKKSILARAFRGELGTNDPSDPSAQELLREILSA